ncbi:hypothetical protein B0H10DRAFT_2108868 [Mycena sp. CBHHK59/15]|nr:hypothetical protein B0H10DRAFT_2108868 [Mycena sp. CBHHK59/15]
MKNSNAAGCKFESNEVLPQHVPFALTTKQKLKFRTIFRPSGKPVSAIDKPVSAIDWQPCHENPSFLCGYLEVSTDYSNPSAGTSKLALTNYLLRSNPGRDASFGIAPRVQNLTGNRHDIVSFDQRGLGHSLPKVNCFGSALAYEQFKTNTVFETTFSVPKDPFSAEGRAVLIEQQKEALALEQTQGQSEALGYMSTTTTIYDMEEISRVMEGEDALINFVRFIPSRSIVGAYLGNMLPHKSGKILIDGIVPGDMWSNEQYDSQVLLRLFLTDSEKTYQLYLSDCAKAGPRHCALSNAGDTGPQDIEDRIDAFIDKLQDQPMMVSNYTRPGYLTSGGVRSTFFNMTQMPESWALYARMLASAINDADGAPLMRLIAHKYTAPEPPADPEATCILAKMTYKPGEAWPTAEGIVDDILVTLGEYPRFGATMGLPFWPGTGVGPERFTKTLATPMLIVSNTHDPVTPYAAGKIVRETMGSSARHLVQGAAGHSYLTPTTRCATKVVQGYFADGIIPEEPETWCEREVENYFVQSSDLAVNSAAVKYG